MQRITITIPQCYNDGTLVPVDDMDQIDRDIISMYGGYSRHGIAGAWTDDNGEVYRDFSYRYEILVHNNHADYDYNDLKSYAYRISRVLGQKRISTTRENIKADFIGK